MPSASGTSLYRFSISEKNSFLIKSCFFPFFSFLFFLLFLSKVPFFKIIFLNEHSERRIFVSKCQTTDFTSYSGHKQIG